MDNYTTREDFQKTEVFRSTLAEVLRLPAISVAIDIVRREGAKPLPQPIPGVDYGAQVAAHGAQYVGWCDALKAIESLVDSPNMQFKGSKNNENLYFDEAVTRVAASKLYTEDEIKQFIK